MLGRMFHLSYNKNYLKHRLRINDKILKRYFYKICIFYFLNWWNLLHYFSTKRKYKKRNDRKTLLFLLYDKNLIISVGATSVNKLSFFTALWEISVAAMLGIIKKKKSRRGKKEKGWDEGRTSHRSSNLINPSLRGIQIGVGILTLPGNHSNE